MTLHRFFLVGPLTQAPATGVTLALSEADRHHMTNVLRLVAGDRVIVADGEGREATATLTEVSVGGVRADVDGVLERPAFPRVVLAPGISRRERMEMTIQKATELGVAEIWPLLTERCVVKLDDERAGRRADRWQKIAHEAAKQSQRASVPVVREPMTLASLAEDLGTFDVVLVPWEERAAGGLGIGVALDTAGVTPDAGVLVVIGPEGGLEEAEVATLEAAGGVVVTLGETILRTETAAVVASAITLYELGALGGRAR